MEIIRGIHNLRSQHRGCVATIGNFDGVHLGHQSILRHVREQASSRGLSSMLVCFEPQPQEYFQGDAAPARLSRFREKLEQLTRHGVDRVLCVRFNERVRNMEPLAFVDLLVEGLGVRDLVVGDDFRFGRDRMGDFDLLRRAGERHGFSVTAEDTLVHESLRVSSTRVRECLAAGDFALAERLLGYPYLICGKVVHGRQLGRQLGTPTANIQLHRYRAPLDGVFAVHLEVDGSDGPPQPLPGVANVGLRPTVEANAKRPILEVHVFDFAGDLYRRNVRVTFRRRIREERRFDGLDALKAQVARDMVEARRWFGMARS